LSTAFSGKEVGAVTSQALYLPLRENRCLTVNWTNKKAGKVVITGTRVISKDGKVMTISGKGTNPQGEPMEVVYVFDKR